MDFYTNLKDVLTGDDVEVALLAMENRSEADSLQDARFLDRIAHQIAQIQQERPALARRISYMIQLRGENDRRRFQKMLECDLPDDDTLTLLNSKANDWEKYPEHFWGLQAWEMPQTLPPLAQIASYFLRAKRMDS